MKLNEFLHHMGEDNDYIYNLLADDISCRFCPFSDECDTVDDPDYFNTLQENLELEG